MADQNDGQKSGAAPVTVITSAVAAGIGLVYARGGFDKLGFVNALLSIAGALAFCLVFFGGIHYLLKRWDRWRAG